jgi:hypothetical protein
MSTETVHHFRDEHLLRFLPLMTAINVLATLVVAGGFVLNILTLEGVSRIVPAVERACQATQ